MHCGDDMKNMKKYLKEVMDALIFFLMISMVLVSLHPAIATDMQVNSSSNDSNINLHGDVTELAYKLLPTKYDEHHDALTVYLHAYLEPKEGPLDYSYPNQHKAAIIYMVTVYQSPGHGYNGNGWGLKDGNSDHHTVEIKFDHPKSGENLVNMDDHRIPTGVIKKDYEGTTTYGFAITYGKAVQVLGAEAHLDVNTYISWTIPVYGYTYYPEYSTDTIFKTAGDVQSNSWNPFDHSAYYVARTWTSAVSVEYPYLTLESQSIHFYTIGRFHDWGSPLGGDSSITYSLTWEVIHHGEVMPI